MKKYLITFLIIFSFIPSFSFAQQLGPTTLNYGGLVKCDGVVTGSEQDRQTKCDFNALINMANTIIKWVFGLTIPIIVVMFAYAGFLYMTPSPGNREKSNKMLWAALKGFVIMLLAWFIVSTLLKWLVNTNTESGRSATSLLDQKK